MAWAQAVATNIQHVVGAAPCPGASPGLPPDHDRIPWPPVLLFLMFASLGKFSAHLLPQRTPRKAMHGAQTLRDDSPWSFRPVSSTTSGKLHSLFKKPFTVPLTEILIVARQELFRAAVVRARAWESKLSRIAWSCSRSRCSCPRKPEMLECS